MNTATLTLPSPKAKPVAVVGPNEFVIAAVGLDHGHIYSQCRGLIAAGATLTWVYDPNPAKVAVFREHFPQARAARALDEILEDAQVQLVTGAAVPLDRAALGLRVMEAGKDYFTDKGPFTTLAQLEDARRVARQTGRKYMVCYGERLMSDCGMFAGELIRAGAIGRVIHVLGLGPHRIGKPESRPSWFYEKAKYGGILCDIGSHQCEQFLHYTGAQDARVTYARVANHNHPQFPGLEDFGEAALVADNGASFYFRVDWFTPDGLDSWGDTRAVIQGTDGYMELRKNLDIAHDSTGEHLYLVNQQGTQHLSLFGQVGHHFFGELIRDCIARTEVAMTQAHAFKAAELCLKCQDMADAARG